MTIQIYNTLTRKKEVFRPMEVNKVKIYVCGPTVYDSCHIGHARSAVVFDVIVRYFKNLGFKVIYVRNFTDIDDKIIERSNDLGISYLELSQIYIDSFRDDMRILNVNPADAEPRVTNHISDIIDIIQKLIKNKFAYAINGDVYFAVDTVNSYGKLSGRNKNDMLAGSRIKINENKKNSLDFTLWKSAKNAEPSWKSPWGDGRPGWHIECSAMSYKLLGQTIDIHGGGEDLIFPHHENEIAQSESVHKMPMAHYWMHNGLVKINSKKMSKSLGNWKSIKNITEAYHPEAVRLFLLSNHYRNPINFSQQSLKSYEKALTKIYRTLQRVTPYVKTIKYENINNTGILWNNFCHAMNDDFNTAKCIGILFNAVKTINRIIDTTSNTSETETITKLVGTINDALLIGKALGILNLSPENYLATKRKKTLPKGKNKDQIKKLILKREKARIEHDWEKADKIRNQLIRMGIQIEDKPNHTKLGLID